jgi:hypothetical protein
MLKNNLISDKKWKQITANAKTCMDLVKQIPAKTQRQSQVDTLSIKKVNKIREMIQQQHKEDKDLANKE